MTNIWLAKNSFHLWYFFSMSIYGLFNNPNPTCGKSGPSISRFRFSLKYIQKAIKFLFVMEIFYTIYIYIWGVFCEFKTILLSSFVINKLNIKVRSRHHLEATRISWCICSWCQNKICIHQRKLLSKCIYISSYIDVLAGYLGQWAWWRPVRP